MKKIIISLSFVLLLISCAKEEESIINQEATAQKVTSFEDYLKFINSDTKGQILIQSVSSLKSENNIYNLSSSIKGNQESPLILSLDNKVFNSPDVYKSSKSSNLRVSNKDLSVFFGKSLKLEMHNKSITARTSSSTAKSTGDSFDVYIPELLKSKVNGLVNGKVVAGTTITWNADSKNVNGVILTMEYKPLCQSEASMVEKFSKNITRGSTTVDSGFYTITASDLSHFPDNSNISFFIGRAGYSIVNDKTADNDVSVGGITTVRTDFEIKK